MINETPVITVPYWQAEIGDVVIMPTCNCGDTKIVDFMTFEKMGAPLPPEGVHEGEKVMQYWRRIK